MYRLAYRNLGGTETMVVNHAVQIAGSSRGNPNRNAYAGVRWVFMTPLFPERLLEQFPRK